MVEERRGEGVMQRVVGIRVFCCIPQVCVISHCRLHPVMSCESA